MKRETAILMVSFGTAHLDTLERSITATEKAVEECFPGYPIYRAFLNVAVIRSLRERHALQIDNVAEALVRIEGDGFKKAAIQPTLLLRGAEYGLLAREAQETGIHASLGRPLLETVQDCEPLASIIIEENPLREREALVLMGHGTEYEANAVYHRLQDIFEGKNYPAFICTVGGTPSFQDTAERLVHWKARRARLLPLMFVAGSHARNDMAGREGGLLAAVRDAGILPDPIFRGLGESRSVQALYAQRVGEAIERIESLAAATGDKPVNCLPKDLKINTVVVK